MADLLFFTDRYPYNNSETFIENEIFIMAKYFDNIYCLPCGLMVDTSTVRRVPDNVHVLKPPCVDNIYQTKPSVIKKFYWAVKNLFPWFLLCLFSKAFRKELRYMFFEVGFSQLRLLRIFRTLAPALRNLHYYKRQLRNANIHDYYAYSYWIEPTIIFSKDILPDSRLKKTLCRTHRWDLYIEESPINYLAFQKQVISFVDHVFVISQDGVKYLNNLYPEYQAKFQLSRLGTTDIGINPSKRDGIFRIVSCSNLIPVKRVDLIIDTLAILSKKYSNIEWIHFGSGQFFELIKHRADEKLSNIHYELKGIVPNFKILDYYLNNHVDLFVNVSSSEGIPVSIMEACSCGIPVIATNVGGTSEIVHHNINGYLLKKDFTLDEFANKIEFLMQFDVMMNNMRKYSRLIWEESFNCVKNYTDFYSLITNVNL